jgi:hypothetical protein
MLDVSDGVKSRCQGVTELVDLHNTGHDRIHSCLYVSFKWWFFTLGFQECLKPSNH